MSPGDLQTVARAWNELLESSGPQIDWRAAVWCSAAQGTLAAGITVSETVMTRRTREEGFEALGVWIEKQVAPAPIMCRVWVQVKGVSSGSFSVASTKHSSPAPVTTPDVNTLSRIANSLFLARQPSPQSPLTTPFPRINWVVFRARREGKPNKQTLMTRDDDDDGRSCSARQVPGQRKHKRDCRKQQTDPECKSVKKNGLLGNLFTRPCGIDSVPTEEKL